ncbi:carbohydrate ABC transporter permease [Nonomuraea soli]|uniref:carbohydrate ABC transporter permease n=1 Tax=Nonomuraea soli TaxID=1032476 RepID=UPI0028B1DCB6|nr:sugar ABC transporter permease [Nonomuraea soli]
MLVAPAAVWLVVFSAWPAINTVILSFTNAKPLGGGHFTGLQNFERALDDDQLLDALINSVVYMLVCVPLLTFLPLLLAVLVEKRLPGITFFRTAFYTPVIASAVVVAIIWGWLLSEHGMINGLMRQLEVIQEPLPFLTDRWLLLFSAISLTVWKGLGYYMIIYLSALGNVRRELHEAAAVDGAGPVRRFFHITVPGVRGTMLLVSVLISVSALRVFSELYVLSNGTGGPGGRDMSVVMLIQLYSRGFTGHLGYASALSLILLVITIGPMLLLTRLGRNS